MNAIDKIGKFNKFGSILGLERMKVLMELLGNPQEELKCIHVAGTNGKGSVCKYIYEVLLANGYNAGMYLSPFIEEFNERIQLGGKYISDDELNENTEIVIKTVEKMVKLGYDSPTEFEVITAIAFLYFAKKKADFVVLEVGLGGKGDSTNVISNPLISVITSISLDHTQRLGNTLGQIAAEKAGIIKKGVPVVSNVEDGEAAKVIARTAYNNNSLFADASKIQIRKVRETLSGSVVNLNVMETDYSELEISMTGEHQIRNLVTAIYTLEVLRRQRKIKVSREKLYEGIKRAVQIGRFEVISQNPYVILDGAHNEAGAAALAETMGKYFERDRVLMVCGILQDKDLSGIVDNFIKISNSFVVCEPQNERKLNADILKDKLESKGVQVEAAESAAKAVEIAENKKGNYDALLFAGSLYLIGEIRRMINNGEES